MTTWGARLAATALGAWLTLAPGLALACPVCFSAQNEENRYAFVAMTVFLTLLPLGMLGLGLGWAWRKLRQQDGVDREPLALEAPPAKGAPPASVRH